MYGNFGENLPSIGTGIFFLALKTGMGLSCTIYKIPVNFSLFLERKGGTTGNPIPVKAGKGKSSELGYYLFSENIPPRCSALFPKLPDFPYKR